MRWTRVFAAVTVVSTVLGVQRVSVFAQSDDRTSWQAPSSASLALHAHPQVTRVYLREQSFAASGVTIPENLSFPSSFRPFVESMVQRSATFRRQCLRIAKATLLTVRVVAYQDQGGGRSRARTEVRISGGRMVAIVNIRPLENVAELIAHELEHVIEQLDGVDLRARSALAGTGVWYCDDGSFETTRAVRMGRAVAAEVSARP